MCDENCQLKKGKNGRKLLRLKTRLAKIEEKKKLEKLRMDIEKAEAEKILQVKNAEADAEAKYLLGAGVAKQRSAIVNGLQMTVGLN